MARWFRKYGIFLLCLLAIAPTLLFLGPGHRPSGLDPALVNMRNKLPELLHEAQKRLREQKEFDQLVDKVLHKPPVDEEDATERKATKDWNEIRGKPEDDAHPDDDVNGIFHFTPFLPTPGPTAGGGKKLQPYESNVLPYDMTAHPSRGGRGGGPPPPPPAQPGSPPPNTGTTNSNSGGGNNNDGNGNNSNSPPSLSPFPPFPPGFPIPIPVVPVTTPTKKPTPPPPKVTVTPEPTTTRMMIIGLTAFFYGFLRSWRKQHPKQPAKKPDTK